jgi:UDP-N-acetyl-D-mannosaminuronic acid dehydrogenase
MNKVVTVGLGYIGLPTSALMADFGLKVHGVDINPKVVNTINKGQVHIVEPDLDEAVRNAVRKGNLSADIKPVEADVYLIVVPTPFKEGHEPDISYVESATDSIIPLLKKGDLYIIESTSPVGTTEQMRNRIFNKRPELKERIHIAYCPERVLPGNVMYELVNNDRVIGGVDIKSTERAIEFYKKFVKGTLHATNARTAEMCKLVENSSRDVQIAFANELSIICDKENIQVNELIALANKHPRVNILNPGCGVGGHCIAVDPYFIISKHPLESKIIGAAREINNYKSFWVVEKILGEVLAFEKENARKPNIALLGLAFKPNIDDLRESPALYIAKKIQSYLSSENVRYVEPNIEHHDLIPISTLDEAMKHSEIMFVLVGHSEFSDLDSGTARVVKF